MEPAPPSSQLEPAVRTIVFNTRMKGAYYSPSVSSQSPDIRVNADGSVDVYFRPKAPAGKENDRLQTLPGKGWFMILLPCGPPEPWFDKTWCLDPIQLIK